MALLHGANLGAWVIAEVGGVSVVVACWLAVRRLKGEA